MNTHTKTHNKIPTLLTALACLLLIPAAACRVLGEDTRDVVLGLRPVAALADLIGDDRKPLVVPEATFQGYVRDAFQLSENPVGDCLQAQNERYADQLQSALGHLKDRNNDKTAQIDPVAVDMKLRGLEALERAVDAGYYAHKGPFWKFKFIREPFGRFGFRKAWWPFMMSENSLETQYRKIKRHLRTLVKDAKREVEENRQFAVLLRQVQADMRRVDDMVSAGAEGLNARHYGDNTRHPFSNGENGSTKNKNEELAAMSRDMFKEYMKHRITSNKFAPIDEGTFKEAGWFTMQNAAWAAGIAAGLALLEYKFGKLGLFASDDDYDDEGPFGDLDDDEEYDDDDYDDEVAEEDEA